MSISEKDVMRVARLARLKIAGGEIANYQAGLTEILTLVAQMDDCDTDGVAPLAHPQDIALRLRDDQVTETNQRERLQSSAPQVEDGLYLVPRVVE
ncbi:MAG: Asp-tRNA(Asn)/Glu-tRNA(Gln) amidotransferase subunit GatC [Arenicellales bacterium]